MKIDSDTSQQIFFIKFHEYGACALKRALERVNAAYGDRVDDLGISRFSGSYNVRKLRGSNRFSSHSWAIALDLFVSENEFLMDSTRAAFARDEYQALHAAFEAEGFFNAGKTSGRDWNHFELSMELLREREPPSSCGL